LILPTEDDIAAVLLTLQPSERRQLRVVVKWWHDRLWPERAGCAIFYTGDLIQMCAKLGAILEQV